MRLFTKFALLIFGSCLLAGCFITTDKLVLKNSTLVPVGNFYVTPKKRALLIDRQKSGDYLVRYSAFGLSGPLLAVEYQRGVCKSVKTEKAFIDFHIDYVTKNKIPGASESISVKDSKEYKEFINKLRTAHAEHSGKIMKNCAQMIAKNKQYINEAKRTAVYEAVFSINAVELKTQRPGTWILAQVSKVIEKNETIPAFKKLRPDIKTNALIIGRIRNGYLTVFSTRHCKVYLPSDADNVVNELTKCVNDGLEENAESMTFKTFQ